MMNPPYDLVAKSMRDGDGDRDRDRDMEIDDYMNNPDISLLSLDDPAPIDYSSDEDSVIIIGYTSKAQPEPNHQPSAVVDLTMSDDDGNDDITHTRDTNIQVDENIRVPEDGSTWPYIHNRTYGSKYTRLHYAVDNGDLETVKSIFEQESHPAGLRQLKIDFSNEMMQQAIANDHGDIVAYYLTHDNEFYGHRIETAIKYKAHKSLKAHLDAGWNINQPRSKGQPPFLSLAIHDLGTTQWFLSHGANPNTPCLYAITPLSLAIRDAPLSVIELLLSHGRSPITGQLLHYLAYRFQPDTPHIAQILLDKGIDINGQKFPHDPISQKASGGVEFCGSPLAEAARAGHVSLVLFLLENGADPFIDADVYGAWSARAWAQFNVMRDPGSEAFRVVLDLVVGRMFGASVSGVEGLEERNGGDGTDGGRGYIETDPIRSRRCLGLGMGRNEM